MSSFTSRFLSYHSRHGSRATAQRAALALKRALFSSRQVVFCCDLASQSSSPEALPNFLKIERKSGYGELSLPDLQAMIEFWNPKLAQQRMEERFSKGASVWLIRSGEKLAGYGWTLRGTVIAPYYFPLGADDVQFFDFHVFPRFRGRAVDWFLMVHILHAVAAEGCGRAFAEAGEWNRASLSSLAMTPFRELGCVRKITLLHQTVVWWSQRKRTDQVSRPMRASSQQPTTSAQ